MDLAGDGPLRERPEDEVERLGSRGRVSFLGLLPREKLLERMRETGAGANRIGRPMADVLSEYGEVTVVALKPSYPSPRVFEGLALEFHDAGHPDAVKRAFSFYPHKDSLPLRTLREQAMALRLVLREPADNLITSSPSMLLGTMGLAVARARNAKFVWDVRDVTWGYARDVAGSSPVMTLAVRMLEEYILYALRRADWLSAVLAGSPGCW